VVVPALAISSAAHSAADDHSTAIGLIHELSERSRPAPSWRARFLADTVGVLNAAGALGSADDLFSELDRTAVGRDSHSVLTAKAAMAASQERWEEAEAMYREAADLWERYGAVFEQARARSEGGRCSMRLGHTEEARSSLVKARKVFAELDATGLKAGVDKALRELDSADLSR
jgi:tetratricopeptide (TPR) repeat protein